MAVTTIGGTINSISVSPNLDYKYGPYKSIEEAFNSLGPNGEDKITIGLTVGIKKDGEITEYWFKDGVELKNLVKKSEGLSAYEIAVKDGYRGSEQDWLASLKASFSYKQEPYSATTRPTTPASSDTLEYIYLVPNQETDSTYQYMWITVNTGTTQNPTYEWSYVGATNIEAVFKSGELVGNVDIDETNLKNPTTNSIPTSLDTAKLNTKLARIGGEEIKITDYTLQDGNIRDGVVKEAAYTNKYTEIGLPSNIKCIRFLGMQYVNDEDNEYKNIGWSFGHYQDNKFISDSYSGYNTGEVQGPKEYILTKPLKSTHFLVTVKSYVNNTNNFYCYLYKDDVKSVINDSLVRATLIPSIGFSGKKVSLLGDSNWIYGGISNSISSVYNDNENNVYSIGTVINDWRETWWGRLITNGLATLEINASTSGSSVTDNSQYDKPGFLDLIGNLGNPDIILFGGGTNEPSDINIGIFDPTKNINELNTLQFSDAYDKLIRLLKEYYPNARLISIIGSNIEYELGNIIKYITNYYNIECVDCREISNEISYIGNSNSNSQYDKKSSDIIYDYVANYLSRDYKQIENLNQNISNINCRIGEISFEERKVNLGKSYIGYVNCCSPDSPKIEEPSSAFSSYVIIDVTGINYVRFIGRTYGKNYTQYSGWGFYDETNYNPNSTKDNDDGFLKDNTGAISWNVYSQVDDYAIGKKIKEYVVKVPPRSKYLKINNRIFISTGELILSESDFYCYLQTGQNIEQNLNEKISESDMQDSLIWKKNLIDINNPRLGVISDGQWIDSFNDSTLPMMSNKLNLVDGVTYTASNVNVYVNPAKEYTGDCSFYVYRFNSNDEYIGGVTYPATVTNSNPSSSATSGVQPTGCTGECTFIYRKSSNPDEAYQRVRLRYTAYIGSNTWNDWKNAQLEVGSTKTDVVPYNSERILTLVENSFNGGDGKALGANQGKYIYESLKINSSIPRDFLFKGYYLGSYITEIPIGENIEQSCYDTGKVNDNGSWRLMKFDISNCFGKVLVSGWVPKDVYSFYLYHWADSDGNKISTEHSFRTTKNGITVNGEVINDPTESRWSWKNVEFTIPDGAKYLYAAGYKYYTDFTTTGSVLFNAKSFEDTIIEYIDEKSTEKEYINILALGNSYSQDSLCYVPLLAKNYGLKVRVGILMHSSSSTQQILNWYKEGKDSKEFLFQYCYDGEKWKTSGSEPNYTHSIQDALDIIFDDDSHWDIIINNVGKDWGDTTRNNYIEITNLITDYVDYPIKFISLMTFQHVSITNTHVRPDIEEKIWEAEKNYDLSVLVSYNGKLYISLKNNNEGKIPSTETSYWRLFYSDWSSTKNYNKTDVITYNNELFYSLENNNLGNMPIGDDNDTYWRLYEWEDDKTYSETSNANAYVLYNGRIFVSRVNNNINHSPIGINEHYWEIDTTSTGVVDEWNPEIDYVYGDRVIYESNYYISKVGTAAAPNTNHAPFGRNEYYWLYYNRPYTYEQLIDNYNSQLNSCEIVKEETLSNGIVPIHTAIQNAFTVESIRRIGSYIDVVSNTTGYGWFSADDGYHLQEGLPCQLAAYTVLLYIFKLLGMEYEGILGDNTMATKDWLSGRNIPGAQGTSCGFDDPDPKVNLANLKFIQKCAVMAMKFPDRITNMETLGFYFYTNKWDITTSVYPKGAGKVTGGGLYDAGSICTLKATANEGYVFQKWTWIDGDEQKESTESTYTFIVPAENREYVANFIANN